MDTTMEFFCPAEEDVSRIRYEALKFGRRVRSASLSGIKKVWLSTSLFALANLLSRLSSGIKEHPYELPTDREQLVECLEQIGDLRQKLVALVQLSEQKGISDKLFFGHKTLRNIKRSAKAIGDAEEAWQLELNNCFPSSFRN